MSDVIERIRLQDEMLVLLACEIGYRHCELGKSLDEAKLAVAESLGEKQEAAARVKA